MNITSSYFKNKNIRINTKVSMFKRYFKKIYIYCKTCTYNTDILNLFSAETLSLLSLSIRRLSLFFDKHHFHHLKNPNNVWNENKNSFREYTVHTVHTWLKDVETDWLTFYRRFADIRWKWYKMFQVSESFDPMRNITREDLEYFT